jgi:hypothetical protein
MTRTRKRPSHSCRNRALFIGCAPSGQATRGVATQRLMRDSCPLQTLRNCKPLPLYLRPVQFWTIPSGLPLGLRSFIWPVGTTSSRSFLWHTNQFARNSSYFSAPATRRHPRTFRTARSSIPPCRSIRFSVLDLYDSQAWRHQMEQGRPLAESPPLPGQPTYPLRLRAP